MAEVEVDHNGKMNLSQFIMLMHNQVEQMLKKVLAGQVGPKSRHCQKWVKPSPLRNLVVL